MRGDPGWDEDCGMLHAARLAFLVEGEGRPSAVSTGLKVDGRWRLHPPFVGILGRLDETQLEAFRVTSPGRLGRRWMDIDRKYEIDYIS